MTRFARAKGSKASNERREEDATPWHVMRQQLVNQLDNTDFKTTEDLSQIVKNVNNSQLECVNEIWSDFGNSNHISERKRKRTISKDKESKVKSIDTLDTIDQPNTKQDSNERKRSKDKVSKVKLIDTRNTVDQSINKKDSKRKKLKKVKVGISPNKINVSILNDKAENYSLGTKTPKLSNTKNHQKVESKNHKKSIMTSEISSKIEVSQSTNTLNGITDNIVIQNEVENKAKVKDYNTKFQIKNRKETSFVGKNHNINNNSYTIIANGREIRIVRYDGFLVKKDDADQLKNLRRKLKSQNIPADKIKAIMKLERRKAEKSLAREKNTVCFHCRKFGHNFADCPDIKESEASKSGICFKCGSTEHTHFQCKVSQNQNFRYAVCFVCKEQGHIARQCTLNPQGQYPKGGSCHLCGEVTHLRRDCPKAEEEKSSKTVTVNSLKNGQLEDIDAIQVKTKSDEKKKKIVKF